MYDHRAPVEGIYDTIDAVDGEDGLDETTFYIWLVVMFGDCSVKGDTMVVLELRAKGQQL